MQSVTAVGVAKSSTETIRRGQSGWFVFVLATIVYSNSPSVAPDFLGPYSSYSFAVLAGLTFLIWQGWVYRSLPNVVVDRFAVALAVWTSMSLASLFSSEVAGVTLNSAYSGIWRAIVFAVLLFLLIETESQFRAVLSAILLVSLLLASLTLWQSITGLQNDTFFGWAQGSVEQISGDAHGFRPAGPIGDPNYYGMYLIPAVFVSLHLTAVSRSVYTQLFFCVCAAIVASAIALTASRGATFALLIGGTMWMVIEARAWKLAAVIVGMGLVALIFNPDYLQRILAPVEFVVRTAFGGRTLGVGIDEGSVFGRFAQLQASVLLFFENPVTGVGFGQYEIFSQSQAAQHNLLMRGTDRSAHSFYLETAAEQGVLGILGLLVLLSLMAASLRSASRRLDALDRPTDARLVRAFGYAMFSVLLCMATLQDSHPLQLWMLIAVSFSAHSVALSIEHKATHSGDAGNIVIETSRNQS